MAKQKTYYIEYEATYSGWTVIRASSKEEAIEIAENSNPDEFLKDQNHEPYVINLTSVKENKTKY